MGGGETKNILGVEPPHGIIFLVSGKRGVMKLNPDHEWTKLPRWKKRIEGAKCYLVCLIFCIINPEVTDYALYQHIKGQFIEDDED